MKSIFEKEIEGKEDKNNIWHCCMCKSSRINTIPKVSLFSVGGKGVLCGPCFNHFNRIVQTARKKALDELKEWRWCSFCNRKPVEICLKSHHVYVPIQAIKQCFGGSP